MKYFIMAFAIVIFGCEQQYREVNTGEVITDKNFSLNCEFGQLYQKVDRGAVPIYNKQNTIFRCVKIEKE
jgi:hypothetical protein